MDLHGAVIPAPPYTPASASDVAVCLRYSLSRRLAANGEWLVAGNSRLLVRGAYWAAVAGKTEMFWLDCTAPHQDTVEKDTPQQTSEQQQRDVSLSVQAGLSNMGRMTYEELLPARSLRALFDERAAATLNPVTRIVEPQPCFVAPDFGEVLASAVSSRLPLDHTRDVHEADWSRCKARLI